MSTSSRQNGRLRQHPSERFAEPVRKLDIDAQFDELLSEDHPPTDGHRQITVSHEDGLTQTLVHFLQGSGLRHHQVNGIVTLHVVDGLLEVRTRDAVRTVSSGELLTLSRGIRFGLDAIEETKLLMTVHLGRHA